VYVPVDNPEKIFEVWGDPPSIEYVYGPVPPVSNTVISPLFPPLQLTPNPLKSDVVFEAINRVGSVIIAEVVSSQPLLSITVHVYVPADKPEKIFEVWGDPPSIEYVYGPAPPDSDTVISPSFPK
jgi:hypothetical protein